MASTRVQQILSAVEAAHPEAGSLPDLLCAACARSLPVTGVALVLMSKSGPGLVAATDGLARTLAELQFSLGEGPCMDAHALGRPVLQPDLGRSGPVRWPGFAPSAREAGIEAIFAFPLQVGGIRLGVLDLYRDAAGPLSSRDLREALAFADAATGILLHLQDQMRTDSGLHPDLVDRTQHRAEVHQATGMVAVQAGTALADSLLLLRAHAYARERSLLEVARDVVARTLRFDPQGEHDGQHR